MKSLVLAFGIALLPLGALSQSVCPGVYATAVRDVDVGTRVATEQTALFNQHCESNGSMKQSSSGLDLTIPIKGVDVGFSGSQADARSKMQQFCKTQSDYVSRFEDVFQLQSRVVVDALRSFNQCVELEKRGVFISHASSEVRALSVRVDFNPATDNLDLRGVSYDPNVAECTSTINQSNTVVPVNASTNITAQKPFSVTCQRKASGTAGGVLKFPLFELLVDTSRGAYPVVMPTEEMYGYDMANATKQIIATGEIERRQLARDNAVLSHKLKNPTVTKYRVMQAKGYEVPCTKDGGDANRHTRDACGANGVRTPLSVVSSRGGGRCGVTTFEYMCVKY